MRTEPHKGPIDHILRPLLPWRGPEGAITECGLSASDADHITRAEFLQRRKVLGPQRASLFTCMTCSQTADRWETWEEDPRVALTREIEWERGLASWHARTDRGQRLKDELLAVAGLIESHREEFAAALKTIEGRREWNARKDALRKSDG